MQVQKAEPRAANLRRVGVTRESRRVLDAKFWKCFKLQQTVPELGVLGGLKARIFC